MKSTKKVLAAMCALTFCMSAAACGDDDSSTATTTTTTGTTAPPTSMNDSQLAVVSEIGQELEDINFENKTLKFFSHWDINPKDGGVIGADIQLFRDKYQGVFEYVATNWDDRYADLAKLVSTNQSPDFFSAMDMDGFPKGAVLDMFEPIDDYVDLNSDLWKSAKTTNDNFMYKNKHYVAGIQAQPDIICIYNTKTIKDAGFDDPYELYLQDKWDFSTFAKMCKEFTNQDEEKVGVDGWWYEKALLHQCGLPIISLEPSGKAVCNVKDATMQKQADAMYQLGLSNVMYPGGCRAGSDNGEGGLGTHQTLFWPCGMWGIEKTAEAAANMGDVTAGELAMCPMPRMDDSDTYYCTARVDGYFLCKGAPNPKLWAAYMNCRMVTKEKAADVYKDQLKEVDGWTDKMIEQRDAVYKVVNEHPVFEYQGSITADLSDFLNNSCCFERWTMNRWGDPTTFSTMIEEHYNEVEAYLKEFNDKIDA